MRTWIGVGALVVWALVSGASCSDEQSPGVEPAPTPACRLNSDCAADRVCREGECVEATCEGDACPCADDAACAAEERCDEASGRCIPRECLTDATCPLGQICDDGRCRTDVSADFDRDGVPDAEDSCLLVANADQEDADHDGLGDACDADDDNDGIADTADACPFARDAEQFDYDGDGVGDACDEDFEGVLVTGLLRSPLGAFDWPSSATLSVVGPAGSERLVAGADGAFQGRLRTRGVHGLQIGAAGHLPFSTTFVIAGEDVAIDPIELTPEFQSPDAAVLLRAQARLQGQSNHFGILVQARLGGVLIASTLTDEGGAFSLTLSRADVTLRFAREAYQTAEVAVRWDIADARFEIDDADVEAWAGITLEPDRSAVVRGRLASSVAVRSWPAIATGALSGRGESRPLLVGADGGFQWEQVQPGEYTLTLNARGHEAVQRAAVSILSGDNDLGTIDLVPRREELQGLVRLQGRDEHSAVTVTARLDGAPVEGFTSRADGSFTLFLLPDQHELSFEHPDFVEGRVQIAWDAAGFTVVPEGPLVGLDQPLLTLVERSAVDRDRDGVLDAVDNCITQINADQSDIDEDGEGDACDEDQDGDWVVNGEDSCPRAYNPMQELFNGVGLACAAGTFEAPFPLGGGVLRQVANTLDRPDRLASACGGVGAPELVYGFTAIPGELIEVRVEAAHRTATYVTAPDGTPIENCSNGQSLAWAAPQAGRYLLVIDGGTEISAGEVRVNVRRPPRWGTSHTEFQRTNIPTVGLAFPEDLAVARFSDDALADIVLPTPAGQDDNAWPWVRFYAAARGSGELYATGLNSIDLSYSPATLVAGDFFTAAADAGVPDLVVASRFAPPSLSEPPTIPELTEVVNRARATIWPVRTRRTGATFTLEPGQPLDLWVIDQNAVLTYAFTRVWTPTPAYIPMDIDTGDLNGDGHADAVVIMDGYMVLSVDFDYQRIPGRAVVLLGDGAGHFTPSETITLGSFPAHLQVGHLDPDPHLDFVVANVLSSALTIHRGHGDGTFAPTEYARVDYGPFDVASGDVNGDGWVDLVAIDAIGSFATTLFGRPDGSFEPVVETLGGTLRAMALRDIDGDGALDVAVSQESERDLLVRFGTGSGTFPVTRTITEPRFNYAPRRLVIDDVDADGDQDIVGALTNESVFRVFYGEHTQEYGISRTVSTLVDGVPYRSGTALRQADFDRDGNVDLAMIDRGDIAREGEGGAALIFYGDAFGRFGVERPPVVLPAPAEGLALVAGDIDSDGDPDLVSVHPNQNVVALWRNSGSGLPSTHLTIPTWKELPAGLALTDLNADDIPDIVITSLVDGNSIRWLRGRQGQPPMGCHAERIETEQGPHCEVGVGDPNCGFCVPFDCSVLPGSDATCHPHSGTDGFSISPQIATASLLAHDLDHDGAEELITAEFRSHNLVITTPTDAGGLRTWREQELCPNGSYVGPVCNGSCLTPTLTAAADFDRDGDEDIAATCRDNGVVIVCPNLAVHLTTNPDTGQIEDIGTGASTFDGACEVVPGLPGAFYIVTFDATQDGFDDLLVTLSQPGVIVLLENDGAGAFRPISATPAGRGVSGLTVGDFDDDGVTEFVAVHPEDAELGVYDLATREAGFLYAPGTHLIDSDLPPCAPAVLTGTPGRSGAGATFDLDAAGLRPLGSASPGLCRVVRLEADLNPTAGPPGGVDVTLSAESVRQGFNTVRLLDGRAQAIPQGLPTGTPGLSRWRPQDVAGLARFEGAPAFGRWTLNAHLVQCRSQGLACPGPGLFSAARLHINPGLR